jgi:hypothetical protein
LLTREQFGKRLIMNAFASRVNRLETIVAGVVGTLRAILPLDPARLHHYPGAIRARAPGGSMGRRLASLPAPFRALAS